MRGTTITPVTQRLCAALVAVDGAPWVLVNDPEDGCGGYPPQRGELTDGDARRFVLWWAGKDRIEVCASFIRAEQHPYSHPLSWRFGANRNFATAVPGMLADYHAARIQRAAAVTQSQQEYQNGFALADALAGIVSDDRLRPQHLHASHQFVSYLDAIRIDGRVHPTTPTVDLHLRSLTPAQAASVLMLLREDTDR